MKNITIIVLIILLLLFGWLWYSERSELAMLKSNMTTSTTETEAEPEEQSKESVEQEVVNTTDTVYVEKEVQAPEKTYTKSEKEIIALINNVHASWPKVFKEDDPEILLSYFTPAFTTNETIIDTEEFAHVERHNTKNFKEHLKELAATPYEIKFGKTDFLYVYVKDHIFTTSYRTGFQLLDENGKVLQKSNIISYVSGENIKGEWKVGNYNWIKYDLFDKR